MGGSARSDYGLIMKTQFSRLLTALILLAPAMALASPDSELATKPRPHRTEAEGGPGGAPFGQTCREGAALVGVRLWRGAVMINAVDGLCAWFEGGRRTGRAVPLYPPDGFGAPQDAYGAIHNGGVNTGVMSGGFDLLCRGNAVVSGIQVTATDQPSAILAEVKLYCRDVNTGAVHSTGWSGVPPGHYYRELARGDCQTEDNRYYYSANGLHGRAGSHIDALGLFCNAFRGGPYPTVADKTKAEAQARREAERNDRLRDGVREIPGGRVSDASNIDENSVRKGPSVLETYGDRPGRRRTPDADIVHSAPRIQSDRGNIRLDWCAAWGTQCGQPAAEAFCGDRYPTHPYPAGFQVAPGVGLTAIISTRQVCEGPHCTGFEFIRCSKNPPSSQVPR